MKLTIYVGDSWTIHVKGIETDFQAEEWVIKTAKHSQIGEHATMWTLTDGFGHRCIWLRPEDSHDLPEVIGRSERYSGVWEKTKEEYTPDKKYQKPVLCINPDTRHHFGWAPMNTDL
jgi:hypothetical protein